MQNCCACPADFENRLNMLIYFSVNCFIHLFSPCRAVFTTFCRAP